MRIKRFPQLRHGIAGQDHDGAADAHRHDDQADAEDGIDLADDLIHRQEGGTEVIDEDDCQPEVGVQSLGVGPAYRSRLAGPTEKLTPTMTSRTTENTRMMKVIALPM